MEKLNYLISTSIKPTIYPNLNTEGRNLIFNNGFEALESIMKRNREVVSCSIEEEKQGIK